MCAKPYKKVIDYLPQNKVHTLDWPPKGPDRNPFENLGVIIMKRQKKIIGNPRTKDDLISKTLAIREEIDEDLLE